MKFRTGLIATLLLALLLSVSCSGKEKEPAPPPRTTTSVTGALRVPEGIDAAGITVFAEGTGYMALTSSEGRYTIAGLPVGTYKFRAQKAGLVSAEIGTFSIGEEDLRRPPPARTLDTIAMRADTQEAKEAARAALAESFGALTGRVRLADRTDHSGVVVSLTGTDHRTVTDSAGAWALRGLAPGSRELEASRPGYTPARIQVEVKGGAETALPEMTLAPLAGTEDLHTVFGRVEMLDSEGEPATAYDIVQVVLEGSARTTFPDANGHFEFTDVEPGRYILSASAPGYLLERRVPVDIVDVRAFEATLTLLEGTGLEDELASIRGRVELDDEPGGASGIAVAIAGTNIVAFTDANGEYLLEDVPMGTHEITASLSGYVPGRLLDVEIGEAMEYRATPIVLRRRVERPRVVYTDPENGARGVTIDDPTVVTVQFSKPMDPTSLRAAFSITPVVDFRVQTATGSAGREGLSIVRLQLTGNPLRGKSLRYKTRYTVRVDGRARDIDGTQMDEDHEFSFTTGGPRIIASYPEDGQTDAFPYFDVPVRIYFNAPIDPASISVNDVRISPSTGGVTNLRFKNEPRTGWTTLFLDTRLDYDTKYTITIRRGARSVARDYVENVPFTFSFRTPKPVEGNEYYMGTDPGLINTRRSERTRR